MDMNHRKLISDTLTMNLTSFCEPYCDPNTSGYCPDICFYYCPSSCTPSSIPPPGGTVHHSSSRKNLHHGLIVALSLIGFACFLYCLCTLYKQYRSRRGASRERQETRDHDEFLDEERGPVLDHPIWYIRTVGLQPSVIDSIAVFKFKRGEGLVEGTDCSVCLSEFEDDESLRLLPKCNHAFHVSCIDTWLRSHTNCPMCRAPIVSNPNGTLSPILEQNFGDSVDGEENQAVVSEGSEEMARERGDGDFGSKGVESSREAMRIGENARTDEVQSIRRSVSLDSLAASRLSTAIANAHLGELSETDIDIVGKRVDLNQGLIKIVGGSSFRRSLHRNPIMMKRSFSCSGKVLFSRHARSKNSVLPP